MRMNSLVREEPIVLADLSTAQSGRVRLDQKGEFDLDCSWRLGAAPKARRAS